MYLHNVLYVCVLSIVYFNNDALLFILKGSWIQDKDPFRSQLARKGADKELRELHVGV